MLSYHPNWKASLYTSNSVQVFSDETSRVPFWCRDSHFLEVQSNPKLEGDNAVLLELGQESEMSGRSSNTLKYISVKI